MRQARSHPSGKLVARQLSLLANTPAVPLLPNPLVSIRSRQVWATLAPTTQRQIRFRFQRVLQEVIDAADRQRQDHEGSS